ncbi:MAG: folylpolyglutamate synthase/dihydrofolate synthase family protein [Eubacterium sp.]|nr:folylpolyglutamate synthase/dihydrofolate synthase family protein [Eubacterium sp.]
MNYEEARSYLREISAKGSIPGLDAITALLAKLGNPQDSLKFIHIAGTNGKGSVMAYLDNILRQAGYRTGRYHSPSLFSYEEEFLVAGIPIAKEQVAFYITKIAAAREEIAREGGPSSTIFEVETAMAFLFFLDRKVDLVLLECGMGGLLDATNVVSTTLIELFSSISMDHMQFLGNTLGEIARTKSGIIKPGTVVLTDSQEPEVLTELEKTAARAHASLTVLCPDEIHSLKLGLTEQSYIFRGMNITIHLPGVVQIHNSLLAVMAALALADMGWSVTKDAIEKGCAKTSWPGRFTVVHEHPTVIMDGAHNPGAAEMLMKSAESYFPGRKMVYVMGVFADKDYRSVIRITMNKALAVYTVETPDNPRALPSAELAEAIRDEAEDSAALEVTSVGNVDKALDLAMEKAGTDGIVLAFGSLSWLHLVRKHFLNESSRLSNTSPPDFTGNSL